MDLFVTLETDTFALFYVRRRKCQFSFMGIVFLSDEGNFSVLGFGSWVE